MSIVDYRLSMLIVVDGGGGAVKKKKKEKLIYPFFFPCFDIQKNS